MTGMLRSAEFNKKNMLDSAKVGYPTATDLADYLVENLNYSFREAHHRAGSIVAFAEKEQMSLEELSLKQLRTIVSDLDEGVYEILSLESSLNRRKSYGGTSPEQVTKQIKRLKESGS